MASISDISIAHGTFDGSTVDMAAAGDRSAHMQCFLASAAAPRPRQTCRHGLGLAKGLPTLLLEVYAAGLRQNPFLQKAMAHRDLPLLCLHHRTHEITAESRRCPSSRLDANAAMVTHRLQNLQACLAPCRMQSGGRLPEALSGPWHPIKRNALRSRSAATD